MSCKPESIDRNARSIWATDQVKSSGWSSWLKTLMTMLLLEEQLILGPGNSPLMRITFCGVPKMFLVPYVTFHSKKW